MDKIGKHLGSTLQSKISVSELLEQTNRKKDLELEEEYHWTSFDRHGSNPNLRSCLRL